MIYKLYNASAEFIPVRLRPPFDPLEVWLVDDADPDRADEVGPEHRPHHLVRKVGDLANLGILKKHFSGKPHLVPSNKSL